MVRLADELAAFFPFGALEPIRADLALSYGRASLLLVLYPVVGLFGSVGGVASDHVSRRLLASPGAPAVVTLLGGAATVGGVAGAAAVGGGLYVVWIDVQARTLTLRPGQAGTTGAVVDAISETGAVLPLAIGPLADRAGLPAAMAAFVGLAALLVLAASRIARLRPPG